MARTLLIPLLAIAGCYDPTFADCTTTCGDSALCPDGLTCTDGYCRTAGATDSCEGNMSACPPMPPLQCGTSAPLEPPNCFAVCNVAQTGTAARTFKLGSWHLAVLDTPAKIQAARAAAGASPVWIALGQQAGQTSPAAGWQWMRSTGPAVPATTTDWATGQPDDGDGTENAAQDCGALTSSGWSDEACTASHPLLVTP